MAIRFLDGMTHYETAEIPMKYQYWNLTRSFIESGAGPNGRNCMRHQANSGPGIVERWFSPDLGSTVIVGARIMWTANPSANTATDGYLELYEGTTRHTVLTHDSSFRLRVTRNGTLLATGTTVLAANRWYFVEFRSVIHDTTGEVQVWLNGQPEINVTGVDTRNGATGIVNRVRHQLAYADGSYHVRVVDFYVADATGSYNVAPLGDVRVDTLYPDGAGANTDFDNVGGGSTLGTNRVLTPSSGTVSTTGSVGATNPNNVLDDSSSTVATIVRTNGNKIRVAWSVAETLNCLEVMIHSNFGVFKVVLSSGYEMPVNSNPNAPGIFRWYFPETAIDWVDILSLTNDGGSGSIYDVRAYLASDNANWKAVDDPVINKATNTVLAPDTDYNSSGTPGDKDTYTMSAVSNSVGSIYGLQVNLVHRKDDAGSRTLRRLIRSGGTDYEGSDISVSDSWALTSEILETDPDTSSPWTIAGVNALEAGVKVEA